MSEYEKYYYEISCSSEKWQSQEGQDTLLRINNAIPTGGLILEIGCGAATIIPFLRQDINYVGIDISKYAHNLAKSNLRSGASVLLSSAEHIPYPDHYFDFILALHSLEHVSDLRATLDEILRVLKEKGNLYIKGPNFDWPLSVPSAIRHRSRYYKQWFRVKSIIYFVARLFGYYSFRKVGQNYVEATGTYKKPDDDLRYAISADEIIKFFKQRGFKIDYICPLPEETRQIKKFLTFIPGLKYFGQGMDVILQR